MKKNFNHEGKRRKTQKNFVFFCVFCGKKLALFSFFFLLSFLSACANLPAPSTTPITATEVAENIPPAETEEIPTEDNTPKILRVWLPPQFNPDAETEAAAILRARLDSFIKRRPDLILEIRIKSETGEASLLNTLIATNEAAPSIMPDLVALPRADLENAAELGISHPIDGLTTLLDDPDWFPYARPLAHIQNAAYGLPFAANLLGLRYLPNEDFPLHTLENLIEQESQILFPEDSATLSFCLYDEENMEVESLTQLFTFYQSDLFSTENGFTVQWTNDFLDETPTDAIIVPVLDPKGDGCSLADAWLWTLAGNDPEYQFVAAELAEYLSQSDFLSEWTAALGMLPPRPTALDESETLLHELSLVAQPIPSNDTVDALAEIFRAATTSLVQEQVDPSSIAQEMLEKLQ